MKEKLLTLRMLTLCYSYYAYIAQPKDRVPSANRQRYLETLVEVTDKADLLKQQLAEVEKIFPQCLDREGDPSLALYTQ